MHIPGFGRHAGPVEGQHVIAIEDNSNDETDEPRKIQATHHAVQYQDGLIEVLHENQRGAFICGIPLFSSAGLWPTDPHAWTNMEHKYTPFTIHTATLPDPSWEWTWKRWYVDMSGDVDENGWRYNFTFMRDNWHGHHIWLLSFVRRRRWLRKRRRKEGSNVKRQNKEDYFTIYSRSHQDKQPMQSLDATLQEDEEEEMKIDNIGELFDYLRSCRLDREKLEAIDNFLRHGTDLGALADNMPRIKQSLIFTESRRQLMNILKLRESDHSGQDAEFIHAASTSTL